MYEDIKYNKIKSNIIVFAFVLIVTLILYYVCIAFDFGPASIIIAFTFSCIAAWASYYNSDKIVLSMSGAKPAAPGIDQRLINILDGLVVSSGIGVTPKLYIIQDAQPNAFATGRDPAHSVICVTTGLLEKLNYYELEGVIGHELAHIANYDIRLSAVVTVMVGLVVMLSDMFTRTFMFSRNSDSDNSGNAILMLIGLVLLIFAPIFGKLMQLAISRRREFLADATSVQFTRNPDGLISALEKISADPSELKAANKATAHMYFASPYRGKKIKKSGLWATHPSLEERVNAIRNLK